ncbi:transporter substrate-binding domain-containing protein [Pseudodesulfovibrio tunisiensis]|uniref:transporter substrate-binding domain-containing protein n=1 Tax=Pseudodesulfovibrio tunisiensis TaxID=463192 RepID=UPI001FB2A291|nr:transporter substrate-binding domain-containing protein [Pseudodesulfovibrio tunisiensis]
MQSRFAHPGLAAMLILLFLFPATGQARFERIVVAHDTNYPPFSYLDGGGNPTGLLIDLWRAFGKANKVEVEFRLATWGASIDMVRNGHAHVHGGLVQSPERSRTLIFGEKIESIPARLYLSAGIKGRYSPSRALRIGVIAQSYEEEYMRTTYPSQKLIPLLNNKALIESAAKGSLDGFVADEPSVSHIMNVLKVTDLFQGNMLLYTLPLKYAVAKRNTELLEFLNAGWSRVPEEERRRLRRKWYSFANEKKPIFDRNILLLGSALILLALLLRRILRQRQ